jgi:hypothetical protein
MDWSGGAGGKLPSCVYFSNVLIVFYIYFRINWPES